MKAKRSSRMKLSFEKIKSSKLTKKDYLKIPIIAGIIAIPPVLMTYWTMAQVIEMSLLLITKRGTGKKIVDEEINVNWAGDKFKEFQEKTKDHIFFKKRKKTVISSSRGTQRKYLEKAEEVIPKPKQAYITINRGTKRILVDLK